MESRRMGLIINGSDISKKHFKKINLNLNIKKMKNLNSNLCMNKNNYIFTFLLSTLLFLNVRNSASQWIPQTLPENGGVVIAINFTDPLHGCIGGWRFESNITAKAYYTTDGGENWLPSFVPDSIRAITDIKFISHNTGFATGAYNLKNSTGNKIPLSRDDVLSHLKNKLYGLEGIAEYDAILLETTDSGITWHTSGNLKEFYNYLYQIIPISENSALISGTHQNGNLLTPGLSWTTDGGVSWNHINVPVFTGNFNDVIYKNKTIYAAGYQNDSNGISGIILRSTDSGISWSSKVFIEVNNFTGIKFINKNTGYAGAIDQTTGTILRSSVYKTTNSGTNWNRLNTGFDSTYIAGLCVRDNAPGILFFGNRANYEGNKIIYLKEGLVGSSMNYGNSWIVNNVCDSGVLLNSQNLDTLNVFITGGKTRFNGTEFVLDGMVLHSSKGSFSGISTGIQTSDRGFTLNQNYPNPFNPITIIEYQISGFNKVKLSVFDLNGREIKTLINEDQPAGSYSVKFDGSELSSGVYFYKLVTDNFTETKKMLIVK